MIPLEAASHRSQALCLFIKRLDFLILSRHLRFRGFGAAQLFKRLADGEFRCFSHGKSSFGELEDEKNRANAALPGLVKALHSPNDVRFGS
ncbi:MAG: hypothetical protein WBX77_16700 [Pseudolabrys sp.]